VEILLAHPQTTGADYRGVEDDQTPLEGSSSIHHQLDHHRDRRGPQQQDQDGDETGVRVQVLRILRTVIYRVAGKINITLPTHS
jgi:hypothetical protein